MEQNRTFKHLKKKEKKEIGYSVLGKSNFTSGGVQYVMAGTI